MSKRKAKRPELSLGAPGVSLPKDEKILVKTVPAVIHWSQFQDVERNDTEIVGETLVYQDGDTDIIIKDDISEDAKKIMGYYAILKQTSIEREHN